MTKIFILILFCLLPFALFAQAPTDTMNVTVDTTGQRDLLDVANKLFKFRPRKYPKAGQQQFYFSILPISTAVPGGSKALVTSTTAGFYLGPRKNTYISSVTFAPYFNLKGRYGLPIHSSIWLTDNTYNVQGDVRFLVYPQYTWGLGGKRSEDQRILLDFDYIRFYQSLLKRITPFFYVGVGYDLDYFTNIHSDDSNTSLSTFTNYKYGVATGSSSFSSGLTLNVLYDTRQNLFNPIPGVYGNIIYRYNMGVLGSNNNAQSLYLDGRKYISFVPIGQPKSLIALWAYYWTTLTAGTPFLSLPTIGNDPYQRSGRGIELGRYRGEALAYFETEYRRDITRNGLFGFVVFGNISSASQGETHSFAYLHPACGTGLRVQFNKKSDTNICIDYGVSKGYSNITLALGEAF